MRHWIKLIFLLTCANLSVSSLAHGQQVNPFDIIQTKAGSASTPQIILGANDSIGYYNEDIDVVDSTLFEESVDTLIPESTVNTENQLNVEEDNPFNIRSTNSIGVTPREEVKEEPEIIAAVETPDKSESSWFSKLIPRKEAVSNIDYSLNFIFWILIVSLLILAAVINLKRKSFLNLYRAITNDNYLKLLQREEQSGSSFFFLLLYFLFFLNASLFLYQTIISKFEVSGYKVFLALFGGLLLVYAIRLISTYLLQITFPLEKEAKQFNFTIIMFNIIVGLLLIPVNILIAYAPFGSNLIYLGLGIILLFYVLRQIRGLFIASRTKGLSYFHFFIYLCTFEVAPIVWIISFIKNWYSVS